MRTLEDNTKTTKANQSVEKVLNIIEILSKQNEPVRLHDLAQKLNMNASTTLRFLTTLQKKGYVAQQKESLRYYLTFKICSIANNVSQRVRMRDIAVTYLKGLSSIFLESVNLAIEEDMTVVYVEVINGPNQGLRSMQRIGNIAPMHCTGVGKLMLLNYDSRQIDKLIDKKGLQRFTDATITTKEGLIAELEKVRKQDFAYDNEECEEGVRCIAAPIKDYTRKTIAGISVSGPAFRMTDEFIESKLHYLLDAACQISAHLGYEND